MSTVESKLYGKCLVRVNVYGTDPATMTFNPTEIKPKKPDDGKKYGDFGFAPAMPIERSPFVPEVRRWKMDLSHLDNDEYNDLYLLVTHLDENGNRVRVLETGRKRTGKYEILHVANPCELMLISVLHHQYGTQLALMTAFFVSGDCIVFDKDNTLLAVEAYHRYNNHAADHPAREKVNKILRRNYREQDMFFGVDEATHETFHVSAVLKHHIHRVESLVSALSREGHVSSSRRHSLFGNLNSQYVIAYEDVKEHIGKGADFVGGLITSNDGAFNAYDRRAFKDRLIHDEESFHKMVDFCTQYNADPANKEKLQVVLFPKNRNDIYYAVPALDEFNRAYELGGDLYLSHDVESRYQYVIYGETDYTRSQQSVDKDREKHHAHVDYVKPEADDEEFITDFKDRIVRRSYYRMGGIDTRPKLHAATSSFIEETGKAPVVELMRTINKVAKELHDERQYLADDDVGVISVKCLSTSFLVQVRDFVTEEKCPVPLSTDETPNI